MIFEYAAVLTAPSNLYSMMIVLTIFVLIVGRRIYRGIKGRVYSTRRVLSLPILYIFITIASILPSAISNLNFIFTFFLIFAGLIIGLRFGEKVSFFYNTGTLYYKRSVFVLYFWLISLLVRIILYFLIPANFIIDISIDSILALTSGLLIGEAIHIINSKNRFVHPGSV